MTTEPRDDDPGVGPRHYQALCGVALGVMILVLWQQDLALISLVMAGIGAVALGLRLAINPLFMLLPLALGQVYAWIQRNRMMPGRARPPVLLDVEDVVLCIAALIYLAGHYRLHSLWFSAVPADPRLRKAAKPPDRPAPQARPAGTVTLRELVWFVLTPPAFALLAQGLWFLLPVRWRLPGLPPEWTRLLVIVWVLVVGLFVASQFFRYARRLHMDRRTARLLLQDVVWNETRGEQRRINRWLAWRKVRGG